LKERSRKLFATTETLERLIAALAMIGESSQPVNGYRSPAAIEIPNTLGKFPQSDTVGEFKRYCKSQ